ncbi:MAG TPA: hydrogenase maturation protease [Polyangiaceae bacterium]|nr:hydrogenase maturation protease [Polyangiaceae bacterium]
MTSRRILVAGIGNVFMGDDAFGVAVVRGLFARPRRQGVTLMDVGIRGIDLTYALTDGYDAAVLVDAAQRGHAPGTLYVLEPAPASDQAGALLAAHDLDPARVLAAARGFGEIPSIVRIVGCEPAALGTPEEPLFELSAAVTAAIAPAILLVEELLDELDGPPRVAGAARGAHA